MRQTTDAVRSKIVQRLASGDFCSGQQLGRDLGISRMAVAKHIKALGELGLDIYSLPGKGYRLSHPIQLLDSQQLLQLAKHPHTLQVVNVIDSTNSYIKANKLGKDNGFSVLAEAQTAGRGRRGKAWVSPFAASLYLSCFWSFSQGYQAISGLSLVVGMALANVLQQHYSLPVQLKWPNDVYVHGKKLAGILVEVEGKMGEACDCIIGIGLNIALQSALIQQQIDQPWIDLAAVCDGEIDRNRLAAALLDELVESLTVFEQQGLQPYLQRWQQLDWFYGHVVSLSNGEKFVSGLCKGIDQHGGLLLEVDGKLQAFYGGEISARRCQ